MSSAHEDTLLAEKARLKAALRAGDLTKCACCGQTVKLYKRSLNSHMARALILFCIAQSKRQPKVPWQERDAWIAVRDIDLRGGEYAKLRWWGLLERLPPDPNNKNQRDAAIWRPTPAGRVFAANQGWVDKYVYLYNNKRAMFPGEDIEQITIEDALAAKFDWAKLTTGWSRVA